MVVVPLTFHMLVQTPHSGVLPVQRPSENTERKVATVVVFGACAVQTNNSLFYLILYVPSTIFQLIRDGSSCNEIVLS